MRSATLSILTAVALATVVAPASAQHAHAGHHDMTAGSDSMAVVHTVEAYHAALAVGDSAAALALLADDALILETGGLETRDEYRAHHLPGDMAFAAAVPRSRSDIQVMLAGDVAWTVSTSETKGTYRDREIDSRGAELMVLSRVGEAWKIRAIHWSSRANRR